MPLNEVEKEICKAVVRRFITQNDSTSRRSRRVVRTINPKTNLGAHRRVSRVATLICRFLFSLYTLRPFTRHPGSPKAHAYNLSAAKASNRIYTF